MTGQTRVERTGTASCSKCSDRAYQISSRHGSQSDANDSSLELTGSWWGCYLHSSAPSVAAVYATLLSQCFDTVCCRDQLLLFLWRSLAYYKQPLCRSVHYAIDGLSRVLLPIAVSLS